jgi:predicted RNA-binding protein
MCLSTVYELGVKGSNRMLCEYTSTVEVRGDMLFLTDITGNEIRVAGTVEKVDLVKNRIFIRPGVNAVEEPVMRAIKGRGIKKFEMIREIFNSCDNNQMRDVDISEIEIADPDEAVKTFLVGKQVKCEKSVKKDGSVIFDINTDGLNQRISYIAINP